MTIPVVITSEHSSCRVPKKYRSLFPDDGAVLNSHRGWDPGVQHLEAAFSRRFDCEIFRGAVSRLLIELNRSPGHKKLYSEFSRQLPVPERRQLVEDFYQPYRAAIKEKIASVLEDNDSCLHLSLHTFTPELDGAVRNADIGFLYDPQRYQEKKFADAWISLLQRSGCQLRLRRNYPYQGKSDGLTTALREEFGPDYRGIELELNQAIAMDDRRAKSVCRQLAETAYSLCSD